MRWSRSSRSTHPPLRDAKKRNLLLLQTWYVRRRRNETKRNEWMRVMVLDARARRRRDAPKARRGWMRWMGASRVF